MSITISKEKDRFGNTVYLVENSFVKSCRVFNRQENETDKDLLDRVNSYVDSTEGES